MSRSIISPRTRLELLLRLTCEYAACLGAAALIWGGLEIAGAAIIFASIYVVRGATWLVGSLVALLSFYLTKQDRVDTLVETLNRLGMPRYTDSYRYDEAPMLVAGISQRADISEDLRAFLMSLSGELQFMRSNRLGLAYVQNLSILNGALQAYQKALPAPVSAQDPIAERRAGRGLQAA